MRDTDWSVVIPEDAEPKGSPTNPYLTGRQALALFLAVVLVLVVYVVGKEK